jgi:hypothetical protein
MASLQAAMPSAGGPALDRSRPSPVFSMTLILEEYQRIYKSKTGF